MFDSLGNNLPPRRGGGTAATGQNSVVEDRRALFQGKGHVVGVEKNMPSLVGVFGGIDRGYRPLLTNQLFGPATPPPHPVPTPIAANPQQEPEEQVPSKPFRVEATMASHPERCAADLATAKLQVHADALARKLRSCDESLGRRDEEVRLLVAQRDVFIAKKKNRLRHIRGENTLGRQDPALMSKFSHQLATEGANRNVVTASRPPNAFAAWIGIPGQFGYMERRSPQPAAAAAPSVSAAAGGPPLDRRVPAAADQHSVLDTSAVVASTSMATASAEAVKRSSGWTEATRMSPLDLIDRIAAPAARFPTQTPSVGIRCGEFSHRKAASAAPFACDAKPDSHIALASATSTGVNSSANPGLGGSTLSTTVALSAGLPRRVMERVTLSKPVKWFEREVNRSMTEYNRAIVFTPNVSSAGAEQRLLRRATLPLNVPAAPSPKPA